jgi:hypothetical protein
MPGTAWSQLKMSGTRGSGAITVEASVGVPVFIAISIAKCFLRKSRDPDRQGEAPAVSREIGETLACDLRFKNVEIEFPI